MPDAHTKVLLLSSDYGEGHNQVAEAIKQVIQLQHPEVRPRVVNVIARLHPRIHPIGRKVFIQTVKRAPSIYGYLYRKTYKPTVSSQMLNELSRFGLRRLKRLLEEEQPTVVVSTFPFAAGAMSMLRERGITRVPTVTVITDHTVHRAWIHPQTDFYIVGSLPVRDGLIENGVSSERITVTGIPLRPVFEKSYDKQALRIRHHLETSLPTVLLMGGGFGVFGDGMFDFAELEKFPYRLQMIIIAGHNDKLRITLQQVVRGSRHKIVVLGYVHAIHEWMALSDIFLTKPGGVSTSEALALEVPMLLYKPLPGQEEDNLRHLVRAGVARAVSPQQTLLEALRNLLQTPEALHEMKACAQKVEHKHAAEAAVKTILEVAGHAQSKPLQKIAGS